MQRLNWIADLAEWQMMPLGAWNAVEATPQSKRCADSVKVEWSTMAIRIHWSVFPLTLKCFH